MKEEWNSIVEVKKGGEAIIQNEIKIKSHERTRNVIYSKIMRVREDLCG